MAWFGRSRAAVTKIAMSSAYLSTTTVDIATTDNDLGVLPDDQDVDVVLSMAARLPAKFSAAISTCASLVLYVEP